MKYGNKKTTLDGIVFDSKKESVMYANLKLLQKAGEISHLELQPRFVILEAHTRADGEKIRALSYVADFKFYDHKHKRWRVLDAKGMKTPLFKLKEKLFNFLMRNKGIVIEYDI